jgi:hypothetical protein
MPNRRRTSLHAAIHENATQLDQPSISAASAHVTSAGPPQSVLQIVVAALPTEKITVSAHERNQRRRISGESAGNRRRLWASLLVRRGDCGQESRKEGGLSDE